MEDFPQASSRRSSRKQLQFHTVTQQGRGRRAALFRGHGEGPEEEKAGLIQYCRQIDSAVLGLLNDEKAPMMVTGLDYLVSTYRQTNTYQHLVEDSIQGNPYSYSRDSAPCSKHGYGVTSFMRWRGEALARFSRGSEEGRVSTDVAPLLQAAEEGRIEMLLVSLDTRVVVCSP